MWGRVALRYPFAYSSQVCAIYYQRVVNNAAYKKKPVKGHPGFQHISSKKEHFSCYHFWRILRKFAAIISTEA